MPLLRYDSGIPPLLFPTALLLPPLPPMLTLLLAFCTLSLASPLPAPSPDDPTELVGPALIESRISMTPALLTALGARNHADAILMLQGMPAARNYLILSGV